MAARHHQFFGTPTDQTVQQATNLRSDHYIIYTTTEQGARVYVIDFIVYSRELSRMVTIPGPAFHSMADMLACYPELRTVKVWHGRYPVA